MIYFGTTGHLKWCQEDPSHQPMENYESFSLSAPQPHSKQFVVPVGTRDTIKRVHFPVHLQ